MSKVSVIMPVYNAEKYLKKAIESVLNQTYTDFELLLINDRSTDNSKEICVEYSKEDNRIILLENNSERHGPGPTRNIGLDHAIGEYIYFMDADDWIETELLEQAVKRIEKDQSDMVTFGSINEFYGEHRKSEKSPEFKRNMWTREEIKDNILEYWKVKSISLWAHLFRRRIIDNFRFEAIPLSEDICFFMDILTRIESISCLSEWLYHYRILADSICHRWNDDIVEYQCVKWTHERAVLKKMCPEIAQTEYTEILMMGYLRIIYELALPWCPLKFHERWKQIEKAQGCMEVEKYRKYINYNNKRGLEKIKYFLIKKGMEKLVLILGTISLKRKTEL